MNKIILVLIGAFLLAACGPKRLGCGPKRLCDSTEKQKTTPVTTVAVNVKG